MYRAYAQNNICHCTATLSHPYVIMSGVNFGRKPEIMKKCLSTTTKFQMNSMNNAYGFNLFICTLSMLVKYVGVTSEIYTHHTSCCIGKQCASSLHHARSVNRALSRQHSLQHRQLIIGHHCHKPMPAGSVA